MPGNLLSHLPHLLSAMLDPLALLQILLRWFVIKWYFPGPILIFAILGVMFYPLLRDKRDESAGSSGFSLKERLKFLFPAELCRDRSSTVDYSVYLLDTLVGSLAALGTFVIAQEWTWLTLQRVLGKPGVL